LQNVGIFFETASDETGAILMSTKHTVRSFEEALSGVRADLMQMGRLTREQLVAAAALFDDGGTPEVRAIDAADDRVDDFDARIEHEVQRILVLRQPVADDLRSLLSCDRIATDLERIADHAKNIAHRAARIREHGLPVDFSHTRLLAAQVIEQFDAVIAAIAAGDAEAARVVRQQDEGIDRLFEETFNNYLETMCQTPSTAVSCTNALFIAKALERVGDHVTNIAEDLIYWITGQRMEKRVTADSV
jgi:phosphate transport system protein